MTAQCEPQNTVKISQWIVNVLNIQRFSDLDIRNSKSESQRRGHNYEIVFHTHMKKLYLTNNN